jgi:putative ATP-dependent endonuclease of OLD family
MHISRLRIEKFRSIRSLDLTFRPGKNVIVGRNNAGKSNIIRAMDLLLGEASPTWAKSDNIGENDFFCAKEQGEDGECEVRADSLMIVCELTRLPDEKLNFDEIDSCTGLKLFAGAKFSRAIERLSRDTYEENPLSVFDIAEDQSGYVWVDSKLQNQQTFRKHLGDKYQFAYVFGANRDEDRVLKDMRFLFREDEDSDWVVAFRPSVRNELLQSAIIPSFRDPASQLRITSWSWYGKLLAHLVKNHERTADLEQAFAEAAKIADEIFDKVHNDLQQSAIQVAFPGTEVHLRFNPEQRTDIYKATQIYVDDGFNSLLSEKGSGIQSATIIGLFSYYTRKVNVSTSALLCVEEPELYLHPHARRVVSAKLDDFISHGQNQVVITTHSPEFISAIDELAVILVRKEGNETNAAAVNATRIRQLLFDANQTELFFADKVVLCEGLDAPVLRLIANAIYPGMLDQQNVSVIGVGGKERLALLVKALVNLGIRCYIMTDFDFLLRDKKPEAAKYDAKKHRSLESLPLSFFAQSGIYGSKAETVVSRLAKRRARLKTDDEEGFYTAKTAAHFDDSQLASLLEDLRNHGIGILSGELEDLFRDRSLLDDGKVTVETVYKLSAKIDAGTDPTTLVDTTELEAFLDRVLGFATSSLRA